MSMAKIKKRTAYTIIAGCGRLGANLANNLSEEGENVLIVDTQKDAFRKLSSSFGGQ
ncbi:MAG: NAD-binding protein, partial [Faecousia sp.]